VSDLETTLALVRDLPGWLTDAQARRLWNAAARVPGRGQIVEIGSFRGRSTIVLATAAHNGVAVTAIDPHLGGDRGPQEFDDAPALGDADHAAFIANLAAAGVRDRVRHVRARSAQALEQVRGNPTVLYVDGAHRIRPASSDLRRWGARVPVGGTLLVHDSFSSVGVTVALLREVIGRHGWRYQGRDGSLAEYRRGPELSDAERRSELARGLAQLPWFARNLGLKALILSGLRSGAWPY
jgi:Methyltransferase domain